MNAFNVVRANVSEDSYRCAVATVIRDVQQTLGKSLIDIAEDVGVSLGTVSNAVNEKTGLSAAHLFNLGRVYGPSFLNPVLNLMGAQAAPIEKKPTVDVLPTFSRVVTKIAEARDPNGPGGATEVPQERKAYLHDLKRAVHEGGCLVAQIEDALA